MKTLLKKEDLQQILDHIVDIRTLASPQIDGIRTAPTYRDLLRDNFRRIRQLSAESIALFDRVLTPMLQSEEALSEEDADNLTWFCRALLNQTNVEELDLTLVYYLSGRLLADATLKNDDTILIRTLFIRINACYANVVRVNRIRTMEPLTRVFLEEGLAAAKRLLPYLEKDRFPQLETDRTKHEVLTMSYFYVALYDVTFVTPEINELRLQTLIDSYERMRDPFYLTHAPAYNRHTGMIRCLEHMGQLTENGNAWGYTEDQCAVIASYTEELKELWEEDPECNEGILPQVHLNLLFARNRFYDGQLSLSQYRTQLLTMYRRYANDAYDMYSLFGNVFLPTEYLATFAGQEASGIDAHSMEIIDRICRKVIDYLLRSINAGAHYFLLEYVANFLHVYFELPGGMSFLELGLKCLAALYPPTYVHSVMTASIAAFLVRALIDKHPETLTGALDTADTGDVIEKQDLLIREVFFGGLTHDFGKLLLLDTLFIFWRKRFDEDYRILDGKTKAGVALLERHASTAPYAAYAEYDTHPEILFQIVRLAHVIDDMTDTTARIYRTEKATDEVLQALFNDEDDPYPEALRDLLRDKTVTDELQQLLVTKRQTTYEDAFLLLKTGIFRPEPFLSFTPQIPEEQEEDEVSEEILSIRNALTTVIGMSEAILKETDASVSADHAASVLASARDIAISVNRLADAYVPFASRDTADEQGMAIRGRHWPAFTAPDAAILCLDHARSNLNTVSALLRPLRLYLNVTDSAQHCLELVCERAFDLILVDDEAAFTDSRTLVQRIRQLPDSKNKDVPVILLSADGAGHIQRLRSEAGFQGSLMKPFDAAALERLLLEYLPSEKLVF